MGRGKKGGDKAIKDWIAENMKNTSVTAVLIGTETSKRDWVDYEIRESFAQGKGMIGIYIHNCRDNERQTCAKGNNPFDDLYKTDENGQKIYLSEIYPLMIG